jgi:CheY-like chemotaxis protein/class 3 adenylate cyclase
MSDEHPGKGLPGPDQQTQSVRANPGQAPAAGQATKSLLSHLRHDLRTPVNAIIGYSEMLLQDAAESGRDEFNGGLLQILGAGRRILAVISEVLGSSRPDLQTENLDPLWMAVRQQLAEPIDCVLSGCQSLLAQTQDPLLKQFASDLERIRTSALALASRIAGLRTLAEPTATSRQTHSSAQPSASDVSASVANTTLVPGSESGCEMRGNVLIVDDNAVNRDILARWLYRQGHHFTAFSNGIEALNLLRTNPSAFDLALLDILMPGMDGIQVLEELKRDPELRHLPVIMISALDEMDNVVRCIEMGADDYLSKPFDPVLLRARIGACLERKRLRDRELDHLRQIKLEQERADALLHVILPAEVVIELKATNAVRARRFENVAVLFADIVGFTSFCDLHEPDEVLHYLQQLVESWEEIALRQGVEKIKTIGDAFMATAGLLKQVENPVLTCVRCGLEMIAAAEHQGIGWAVRIGIHHGPVVAGVLGHRQYLFDLWGDTVNTAARMESHSVPGRITLSDDAWQKIAHCCRGESPDLIHVKGKGMIKVVRFREFID